MSIQRGQARHAAWVVVLGLLASGLLAACGGEASPGGVTPSPTTEASPTQGPENDGGTTPTDESPQPGPGEVAFAIRVEKGKVVEGGGRGTAKVGDLVHLVVLADEPDEVHVHGYDLSAPVGPDEMAHLEWVASAAGVFEIELEESHLLLMRLEVRP